MSDVIKDAVDQYCEKFIGESDGFVLVDIARSGVVTTVVAGDLGQIGALGLLAKAQHQLVNRESEEIGGI